MLDRASFFKKARQEANGLISVGGLVTTLTESERQAIRDDLRSVVHEDAIDPWLDTPNPAFDGDRPVDLIARGETVRVRRMVAEMRANTAF